MSDNVNKPEHYTFGKYECIDVIEELSKQNNGVEDLQKARWYLDKLISTYE